MLIVFVLQIACHAGPDPAYFSSSNYHINSRIQEKKLTRKYSMKTKANRRIIVFKE
jgi:hypothetical protein